MNALKPSEVLAKAADLIEPEGAWMPNEWRNEGRTCFCAEGAIAEAMGVNPASVATLLESRFLERSAALERYGVPDWNDAPNRTQAEGRGRLPQGCRYRPERRPMSVPTILKGHDGRRWLLVEGSGICTELSDKPKTVPVKPVRRRIFRSDRFDF